MISSMLEVNRDYDIEKDYNLKKLRKKWKNLNTKSIENLVNKILSCFKVVNNQIKIDLKSYASPNSRTLNEDIANLLMSLRTSGTPEQIESYIISFVFIRGYTILRFDIPRYIKIFIDEYKRQNKKENIKLSPKDEEILDSVKNGITKASQDIHKTKQFPQEAVDSLFEELNIQEKII